MGNSETTSSTKLSPVTTLAFRILLILFIFLCSSIAFFFSNREKKSREPIPTLTPTPIVTPQILVPLPEDGWESRHETFTLDKHSWELLKPPGKLEIIDEKLVIQSYRQGSTVIGYSQSEIFNPSQEVYYIQADFMTDAEGRNVSYGLVFCLNDTQNAFYIFDIYPQDQTFRLFKYNSGEWNIVIPSTRTIISPYPEPTTLGVLVNKGNFDFHINGQKVSTFVDEKPFYSKGIGILAGDSGYRVIVDNFFVSEK
ncbi:MAG: hypothetical protein J0M11_17160 [Anaerolineae bacterium]|nr:hypothetical protein [Anaerolineae bacterium]